MDEIQERKTELAEEVRTLRNDVRFLTGEVHQAAVMLQQVRIAAWSPAPVDIKVETIQNILGPGQSQQNSRTA